MKELGVTDLKKVCLMTYEVVHNVYLSFYKIFIYIFFPVKPYPFQIVGSYKESKIGYGIGHDIETSVIQAIYDCPFIGSGLKVCF